MNQAELFVERVRVSWFGKAVGKAADQAASLLGRTLGIWLRLSLYLGLAFVAGYAVGQPLLVVGVVLGVVLVAELLIGLVGAFWRPREIGAAVYIAIWWPIRRMVGPSCPVCGREALSLYSIEESRHHILECGR